MPDQELQDTDETKQKSNEGTAITSNTRSSWCSGGRGALSTGNSPSAGSNNLPTIEQPPDPSRPVHCTSCGMQYYFVAGLRHEHNDMNTSSVASELLEDNRPSPRFTSFCGVTLDRAQHGQLSAFHLLGNGDEWERSNDEWQAMAKEVGGLEKLQSLVQIGNAAVRVRVENIHLPGFSETIELSGFRLSHDLVITCAHFTNWAAAENNFQSFLNGANGVCEATQAFFVGKGLLNKNRFTLRLWAIHKEWDIAVFRITHWPANDSKNCVVRKEDVHVATPEERRKLISAPRVQCWSIGYNSAVNMIEFRQRFEAFLSRRHADEKMKIAQEYKFDVANPPGSDFLLPDMRTVSFGTKIEHPTYAKEHQECVELSAWYGRSGSMVCVEKDGRSTIIGIVQGGEESSDCNLILLFNAEMREWWNVATDLEGSSDPQVIGRRVVMG